MSLSIRPATIDDVGTILEFIRALAVYERMENEVVATEAGLRDALFGAEPGAEVILAELDSTPVGFALFFHNFSTFLGRRGLYLEDLFVEPRYRGRGVGRALLSRLATIAVERNCGRLEWSVLDWNEPAIALYKALGAKAQSDWTVYRVSGDGLNRLSTGTP